MVVFCGSLSDVGATKQPESFKNASALTRKITLSLFWDRDTLPIGSNWNRNRNSAGGTVYQVSKSDLLKKLVLPFPVSWDTPSWNPATTA